MIRHTRPSYFNLGGKYDEQKDTLHWDVQRKSWRVLFQGVMNMISARQLLAPDTMAGSVTQAREWWAAKMNELRQVVEGTQHAQESQK